jgi:hypothetical protein
MERRTMRPRALFGGSPQVDFRPTLELLEEPLVMPQNIPHPTSGLLTLTEAAMFLRAPVATLHWRHLGIGPDGFRLGRRVVYRREDLDRWVTEQREAQSMRR